MDNLLSYLGYHEKWHGSIQSWRSNTRFSINESLIKFILETINIETGNFVEFGACDGIKNANTRLLYLNGWSGLYIEADSIRFKELKNNYEKEKKIYISNLYIDDKNQLLDDVIGSTINDKIDFMSIDIDGLDVEIFKSINVFLPTVICIEGGQILEPYHSVVANDISANNIQQSLKTMMELFKDKGYKLLCTYQDSFFIKNEYSDLFNVSNDIFDLYIDGLIALPRIPYIKILLDSNKLKNRIIDYIIQFLDIDEIIKIGLNGGTKEKAIWIDHNFHRIKEKLEELKQLQKEYPYDECDETLWIKISET
jgi:hypothetical protein